MKELTPLTAPVEPATALTRIAWLLERARESTYRVEAFRRAANVVGDTGPAEIERRARAGTLTDLPGIGARTAEVIVAAVAGAVPDYLSTLQDSSDEPEEAGGREIYAAIRGDLHVHTDWSDGGAPLEEMVAAAGALGQDWVAITDHSPRLRVANGLSPQRLSRQLELIADRNGSRTAGTPHILTGIEVDILDDGSLDQTDDLLRRLDVVTASVHSKLAMPAPEMTDRMLAAVTDPRVDVLGHCTGRRVTGGRGTRAQSRFDAHAVFTACADTGTAVEINSRPERVDPPDDLLALARDLGCLFAIDSDAHAPGQLDFKLLGARRAEAAGIELDRIVTTWPVDRLRAWSAERHA